VSAPPVAAPPSSPPPSPSGRGSAVLWLALLLPGLLPVLAAHPPFQDWPGHLGVVGALVHHDDPATGVAEFYRATGALKPNALFYWLAWGLSALLPVGVATRLLFALSVAGLGPAARALCRAVGADERLALFVLPLALGRHVYCGFVPNAAGLALGIGAFAAWFALRARPGLGRAGLLFLLLLATHWMHAFVYLAVVGLLLLAIALDLLRGPRRPAVLGLVASLASFGGMVVHLLRMEARKGGGPGALEAVWRAALEASRGGLARTFWEWLFASYRYAWIDDALQAVWAVSLGLLVLAGLGVAVARRGAAFAPHGRLFAMALVTFAMFVFLPSYVGPPLNWWGGNLRLPPLVVLLLVPLAGPALSPAARLTRLARGSRALVLGLGLVASLGACVGALADLAWVERTEMAGLGEVVEAIPPGRRVCGLHYTSPRMHEYPGEPYGYVANYYLLERGGYVPQNFFEHPDVPFARRLNLPAPPWAMAEGFDWFRHGQGCDGFLLRVHDSVEHAPLHGSNTSRARLVKAAGRWRYYESTVPR
jgi:hypothetical protein